MATGSAIKGFKKSMKDGEEQIDNKDDVIEAKVVKEDSKKSK